jgi:hypothetical protein
MRRFHLQKLVAAIAILGFLSGCTRPNDRPETAPVKGRVMYRGEPVSGATVAFIGENSPRFGSGQTHEDGRFEISTFGQNDGTVVGSHVVTVTKPPEDASDVSVDESLSPEERSRAVDEAFERAMQRGPTRSLLPEKYADPKTTDLRFEVVPGDNSFNIELVD